MLKKITVKNFALIDYAEIIFTEGFNVLSGETGAGKSIVLESLNFVLGAKADKNLIRSGESECFVTAEFDLSFATWAKTVYEELDYEYDDTIIISRKFNDSGKSAIKINGYPANVSILKKFTSYLVDVHGQSEHFSLLSQTNQLYLIDKFGGEEILALKKEISILLDEYKSLKNQLNQLGGEESGRLIRLDVLSFQINEIESANVQEGEEEKLLEIKEKLKHQEKIINALSSIKYSLANEGGVSDITSNAVKQASFISDLSEEYNVLYERLNNVYSEIEDLAMTSENLLESFDFSEYSIDEINERLAVIKNLKKKYGDNYNEILLFLDNAKKEKDKLENFSTIYQDLIIKEAKYKDILYNKYCELSNIRKETAKNLSESVVVELRELGMENAKFNVEFSNPNNIEDTKFDGVGYDSVIFTFSANVGEPLKPLSYIISGGEMSRFMLALKVQTAKCNDISTFVFDEIDAGISGAVAKIVSEKLVKISKNVQVVSISHLPQIVSFGDNNLLIYKTVENSSSHTRIKPLSKEDKVLEISRLIGGDINSSSANIHAMEMIKQADAIKKSI